jgi:hypothetical protein
MSGFRHAAAAGTIAFLAATQAHAIDPPEPRERIEALELDAAGRGGTIRTRSVYLVGEEAHASYGFGQGACRAHTVAPATLDALHEALRSGQLVRIHASARAGTDGDPVKCVERVTFFAPQG